MRTLVVFGLGALTMYLLDPVQGRRRRALMRDQYTHAKRLVRERAASTAPVRTQLEPDQPSDAPESAQHLGR